MSPVPHVLLASPLEDAPRLTEASAHHLRRVLRLEVGSALSVTDGRGRVATARLTADGVALTSPVDATATARPELVLVQALAKGRRLDDAVRAACELGVERIVPVIAERTQGRPSDVERTALVERWRALARSALEQSRSTWLTRVDEVRTVADLAGPATSQPGAHDVERSELRLLAVPHAAALSDVLPDVLGERSGAARVSVAVGPEGGWSDAEVALLSAAGWVTVGLGRSVLRTEHAGLVALAALAALTGRWRDGG